MGFFERVDTILNWTELNCGYCAKRFVEIPVPCRADADGALSSRRTASVKQQGSRRDQKIKRSRGGRWSWTFKLAQKRS